MKNSSRRLAEGGKLLVVAQGFDDMEAADAVRRIEIGNGAAYPQQ